MYYDIISLTHADENDKLHRKIITTIEEVPATIREHFQIVPYEEAKGKKAPGKNWVTLSKAEDEKSMILLFILERAWTISTVSPEEKMETIRLREELKPPISLYVRPKIERTVHVKVKAHAHKNNMAVSDAYKNLIESVLEVAS